MPTQQPEYLKPPPISDALQPTMPVISFILVRTYIFGHMINAHPSPDRPAGLGMFVCTYVYMFTWVYTGEINAKRIRERYLKAVLRQDIAWFDNTGAGEVATRIQTDTRMFQSTLIILPPFTIESI